MIKPYTFNNNSPVFTEPQQEEAYIKAHNLDIIREEENDCYITKFCTNNHKGRFIYHVKKELKNRIKK